MSAAAICPLTAIAWRLGALPVRLLWADYIAVGGNQPGAALLDDLDGTVDWSAAEHNALAQVLNETLWELGYPSLALTESCGTTGSS